MTRPMTGPLPHQQGEHMRSAVERIAAFAAAARPEHLTNDTRRPFKRNILDSLGRQFTPAFSEFSRSSLVARASAPCSPSTIPTPPRGSSFELSASFAQDKPQTQV
jgi:hypothetical protein